MKKQFFFLLATLAMVACNNQKVYTIEGSLEGFSGAVALTDTRGEEWVSAPTNEDGTFKLEYESEAPFMALIRIDEGNDGEGLRYITQIYGDDVHNIKISGTPTDVVVDGGAANKVGAQLKAINQQLDEMDAQGKSQDEIVAFYEEQMENLYQENKDNLYGVMHFARQKSYEMSGEEILATIESLPKAYKNMPNITKLADRAKVLMNVAVGKKFTDLEVPDADGNIIKLSDVVAKNKYVLLDFWASWCGPCMGEVPYLVEVYKEYHDKGFEIYGVSLDKAKEPWLRTIENKQMNWVNVSNVKYWSEPSAALYGVGSIPSNFLIDSEGTIVARNLRGEQVAEKLAELLK